MLDWSELRKADSPNSRQAGRLASASVGEIMLMPARRRPPASPLALGPVGHDFSAAISECKQYGSMHRLVLQRRRPSPGCVVI